ncbi:hypothetical protein DPMN_157177 [Dreissena polymorpha]|uniref:Uncharacterized protein n=1 Tax=Dreissena polymorpha TaxID=45954 RepID=A0A9D4IM12_DREPO|nr:hypothetical protein DPMN_157177 [Dreissena polymorpha]
MVDIGTYRARIGCFTARSGSILDLATLRVVGVFGFIGILLFMAGVELNPGPFQLIDNSNPDKATLFVCRYCDNWAQVN